MNSLSKLALLLILVAIVASSSCWMTGRFLPRHTSRTNDFHHWLHTRLGLNADQDRALDREEDRFAGQSKELGAIIKQDNAELAAALLEDQAYSPRVVAAVEKIHHAQSALEEASLAHIFAMKPILSPAQFDQLLRLTSEALNNPPDL